MQLFYHPEITDASTEFTFPEAESKHISKVLRKATGDTLQITNGRGGLYAGEILFPDPKRCTVRIISMKAAPLPPYRLHLVVAPTKLNDRFEWFLEKATEIGVQEITPIICERSERKTVKGERMEKVLLAAMKQSLHTYLPQLNEAVSFKEYLALPKDGDLFIAHCDGNQKQEFFHALSPGRDTTILIGPEGDFSPTEIKMALEQGFRAVALGNSRLRTETAAIVACTTVALANLVQQQGPG